MSLALTGIYGAEIATFAESSSRLTAVFEKSRSDVETASPRVFPEPTRER